MALFDPHRRISHDNVTICAFGQKGRSRRQMPLEFLDKRRVSDKERNALV